MQAGAMHQTVQRGLQGRFVDQARKKDNELSTRSIHKRKNSYRIPTGIVWLAAND